MNAKFHEFKEERVIDQKKRGVILTKNTRGESY